MPFKFKSNGHVCPGFLFIRTPCIYKLSMSFYWRLGQKPTCILCCFKWQNLCYTGWSKKTTPNFGGHFDLLPENFYNLLLDAIKGSLFGISCENMKDITFILFKSIRYIKRGGAKSACPMGFPT